MVFWDTTQELEKFLKVDGDLTVSRELMHMGILADLYKKEMMVYLLMKGRGSTELSEILIPTVS